MGENLLLTIGDRFRIVADDSEIEVRAVSGRRSTPGSGTVKFFFQGICRKLKYVHEAKGMSIFLQARAGTCTNDAQKTSVRQEVKRNVEKVEDRRRFCIVTKGHVRHWIESRRYARE